MQEININNFKSRKTKFKFQFQRLKKSYFFKEFYDMIFSLDGTHKTYASKQFIIIPLIKLIF